MTEAEVRAAVRTAGFASLTEVAAVVLETDGSITAVPRGEEQPNALTGLLDRGMDGGGSADGHSPDGGDRSRPLRAGCATRDGERQ